MYRSIERPRRPAIPPTAYALAAIIVVNRMVLKGEGGALDSAQGRIALAAGVLLVLAFVVLRATRHGGMETILAVGTSVLVGLCLTSLALVYASRFLVAAQSTPVSAWRLEVISEPTRRDDVYRCRARAYVGDGANGDVWLSASEKLPVGTRVRCVGRFSANTDDDWGRSSRLQGVWGKVQALSVLEELPPAGIQGLLGKLRTRLLDAIGPEESEQRALLAGCACGHKGGLASFGLDKRFSACGISHLAAVSGSHLSIVVTIVGFLLKTLNFRPRQRAGVLLASSALFVLYCGAPVSAVRSWIMTCSALVAMVLGRRSHALSSVSVAGLILALLDPTAPGQPGFVLSVLSVTGLCLFSPYATYVITVLIGSHAPLRFLPKRASQAVGGIADVLINSVAASVVALLATLPVVADTFGSVSLVSPVANALVVVPYTALVGLGSLLGVFCEVAIVRDVLLVACDALSGIVLCAVNWCSSAPFAYLDVSGFGAALTVFVLVAAATLLLAWPHVSRMHILLPTLLVTCAIACLFVRARYFAPARVCVLDVGQGDAILVQDGASSLLIDTGPDASVAQALIRNNVLHVDAVVVTHLHADHYAGLESISRGLGCKRVYVAKGVSRHMPAALSNAIDVVASGNVEEVELGDTIRVAGFLLSVVWPQGVVDGKENADSLELVLAYNAGGRTLRGLLTGDAEREETGRAIESGKIGDIDFLKVGHHGSAVSITYSQACELSPEVSVASAGDGNSYGHPNRECVDALVHAGSVFLCTKDVGDVEICPGEAGPKVRTQFEHSKIEFE